MLVLLEQADSPLAGIEAVLLGLVRNPRRLGVVGTMPSETAASGLDFRGEVSQDDDHAVSGGASAGRKSPNQQRPVRAS